MRSSSAAGAAAAMMLVLATCGSVPAAAAEASLELAPRSEGPFDLVFPEPTHVSEVYRAWGEIAGVEVLTAPGLRDQAPPVAIRGATALAVLADLARLYRHFHRVLDERTVVVVDDTPEQRRAYGALEVRAFPLRHLEAPAALVLLSSLLGIRHATADVALGRVALLDTPERLEVAGQILAVSDAPLPGVEVDVELLAIERLAAASLPRRLSAGERARFERSASVRTVARSRLSAVGGASAHFEVERGPGDLRTDLELELDARVHEAPAGLGHDVATEVTLGLRLKAAGVHGTVEVGGRELPAYDRRRLATTVRLRDGDSFFLAGVVPATEEMVLAITPRVIRAVVTADPPPAIWLQRAGEVDPAPRGDGR